MHEERATGCHNAKKTMLERNMRLSKNYFCIELLAGPT